jgi:hypothetical protein
LNVVFVSDAPDADASHIFTSAVAVKFHYMP